MKYLKNIGSLLFFIVFSFVNIANLFYSNIEYITKNYYSKYNIHLLVVGLVAIIVIIFIFKYINIGNIYIYSSLIFIINIFLIYTYYFSTGWDPGFEILPNAYSLANDGVISNIYYYSMYPNNILITWVFSKIIILANLIGLVDYSGYLLIVFMVFVANVSGLILYKATALIFEKGIISKLAYVLYLGLVLLSPWISIPYSDTFGLIFPILILYVYIRVKRNLINNYLGIILISFISVIGYNIKPQTSIIFVAIVIGELLFIKLKGTKNRNLIIRSMSKGILAICSVILASFILTTSLSSVTKDLKKSDNIGFLHFIKMGLNNKTNGIYYYNDVLESMEISDKESRDKYNVDIIKDRLKNFGALGYAEFLYKKTLINFNDGTFAWSVEGSFYKELNEEKGLMSLYTRNIYYESGKYHRYYQTFMQMIWITILFLMLFVCFGHKDCHEQNKEKYVVMLTLLGLFFFELIFEARARYLFSNVPIFIMCAMYGLNNIISIKQCIQDKFSK